MNTLTFAVPPFPTYITGGIDCFSKGKKHVKRVFTVFDLLIVKKGAIFMCENEQNYDLKEGQYLILAPGFEHFSYKACEENTDYYWIHFQIEGSYQLKNLTDINWGMVINQERTYTEAAKHTFHIPRYGSVTNEEYLFHEIDRLLALNTTNSPEKRLQEQLIFQDFMLQLQKASIRIPTRAEQVTSRAITYMQDQYSDAQLRMEHLSKQLLLHQDYITRCMQKTIGVTPMQYLTSYRITMAKQLLTTTNEKLDAISASVGICDSAYFSRVFKKIEGIPPMEFRRLASRAGV